MNPDMQNIPSTIMHFGLDAWLTLASVLAIMVFVVVSVVFGQRTVNEDRL